jgi:hypothetical protein
MKYLFSLLAILWADVEDIYHRPLGVRIALQKLHGLVWGGLGCAVQQTAKSPAALVYA